MEQPADEGQSPSGKSDDVGHHCLLWKQGEPGTEAGSHIRPEDVLQINFSSTPDPVCHTNNHHWMATSTSCPDQ